MDPLMKWFEEYKLVAIIRSSSHEDAEAMIKAASDGGVRCFEISMHTPQALRLIENHTKQEGFVFGAGSILDGEMAQRAITAGARFVSSQYTDRDVINVAKHNDSFSIQGASTITEVFNAHQYGADVVMLYPAGYLGGPAYAKLLRSHTPFVKLIARGDVTLENYQEYQKHCVAVAIGDALFEKGLIRKDNWPEVTERARQFTQRIEAPKVAKSVSA